MTDAREELAEIVIEAMRKVQWIVPPSAARAVADAILASGLVSQIRAEALREAADAMDADPEFRDPLRLKSDWVRERAERLEQGA